MNIQKKIIYFSLLVAVIIFRAIYSEGMSSKALYDFDEARYAEVARNVIKTGNILIPLSGGPDEPRASPFIKLKNGESLYPYFWKPPLHTLTIAFFMKILGISEVSVRLPSLLFSVGCVFLVYKLTKKLFKTYEWAPFMASAFFITTNDFSIISSQGLAEAQLLFLSLLSIYFALKKTSRTVFLSGIFFGLAFMTKSFITFWVPILVLFILFSRDLKQYLKFITLFVVASLITILPWHLYMWITFRQIFIDRYIIVNLVGRTAGMQNPAPFQWYLIYMLDQWKPYIFLLPAFSYGLLRDIQLKKRSVLLLLVWMIILAVPLSIAKSKVFWYIFPLWVPFSILLGYLLEKTYKVKSYSVTILTIILSLLSLHPFWQLSFRHIPLKSFIVLSVCVAFFSYFFSTRLKNIIRIHFIVPFLVIFLTANYFSIKESAKRTDWNRDLKVILLRNQKMTHLSVAGMPYETALFYANTGNIDYRPEKETHYLITTQNFYSTNKTDLKSYSIKDREGGFIIFNYYFLNRKKESE